MREILFRGKRLDNDEWVEGYLGQDTIIGNKKTWIGYVIKPVPQKLYEFDSFEVDPDTVGQFTGRFDKHGKQIFDGDILRCCLGDQIDTGVVQYDDRIAAYIVLFADGCLTFLDFFTAKVETWYEVIGNIHDNDKPDFLKEGDTDGKEGTE